MATILEQIKNLEKLNENVIVNQIFKALKEAEIKILEVNKDQLALGQNIKGDVVGRYKKSTQKFASFDKVSKSKDEGDAYNFDWTGEFLKGFSLNVSGGEATIFSTGVGGGDKQEFLTTNNLFGLNDENLKVIIRTEILPFIHKFARQTLKV